MCEFHLLSLTPGFISLHLLKTKVNLEMNTMLAIMTINVTFVVEKVLPTFFFFKCTLPLCCSFTSAFLIHVHWPHLV